MTGEEEVVNNQIIGIGSNTEQRPSVELEIMEEMPVDVINLEILNITRGSTNDSVVSFSDYFFNKPVLVMNKRT